jgi:hypothetical protein
LERFRVLDRLDAMKHPILLSVACWVLFVGALACARALEGRWLAAHEKGR